MFAGASSLPAPGSRSTSLGKIRLRRKKFCAVPSFSFAERLRGNLAHFDSVAWSPAPPDEQRSERRPRFSRSPPGGGRSVGVHGGLSNSATAAAAALHQDAEKRSRRRRPRAASHWESAHSLFPV